MPEQTLTEAQEALIDAARELALWNSRPGGVLAAAYRLAAAALAAMPADQVTTYGNVRQFLEIAAKGAELP